MKNSTGSTRRGIGIYVSGPDRGMDKVVDQILRIITCSGTPASVAVQALITLSEIHRRPINISNCQIDLGCRRKRRAQQ